jgi:hypothetical protein
LEFRSFFGAEALGGPRHMRRLNDLEVKAPFDPFHYRIIYQTFHGMRDVLGPLRRLDEQANLGSAGSSRTRAISRHSLG